MDRRLPAVALIAMLGCGESVMHPVAPSRSLTSDGPVLALDVASYIVPFGPFQFWNPCGPIPEFVEYAGTMHLHVKTGVGLYSYIINYSNVKGTGITTGTAYVLQDNAKSTDVSDPAGGHHVTFVERLALVSEGRSGKMHVITSQEYSFPPPIIITNTSHVECRG